MHWEAVTALSTAFTGFVIVATALVGIDQLRQLRAQRRDTATIELVRWFQDADFMRAFRLIMALPPDISASDLRERGREYEDAAQFLAVRFEMLGFLVFRETISFHVMEEVAGGATVGLWRRLNDTTTQTRQAQNYPTYLEWFQWVAEQFERRDPLHQSPAHVRHRDWTPTGQRFVSKASSHDASDRQPV